ncbi:MAG: IclR family transcriptional regulator [Acidimicrobiales bacterium]
MPEQVSGEADDSLLEDDDSHAGPQLLDRTFAILGLFTLDTPEWTTTEAARACNLPVPTVHRILTALRRHGYVSRDDFTKRFRLGSAALELGRDARASDDLRTVSIRVLERLAVETEETVLLTALNHARNQSVCLERVESHNALRLSVEPGRQMPLHAGASQKALLAWMREDEIEAMLAEKLEQLCDSTITDPAALREELEAIRKRGWATSYEETNLGLWGIAITLLDGNGDVVAAVGLAGPRLRLPRARVAQVLERLREGTDKIAGALALHTSIDSASKPPRRRRVPDEMGFAAEGDAGT